MITILAAVSLNNIIGRDEALPWRIPSDLTRFRNITMGATVIMGRRTYESLPPKKLPGRNLLVLTRGGGLAVPRIRFVPSLEEALHQSRDQRVFIIGGSSVYEQSMPWVDQLLITRVLADTEGDTYFPPIPNVFRIANVPVEIREPEDEFPTRNELWSRT